MSNKPSDRLNGLFGMLGATTGLTFEDMMTRAQAETPEEKMKADGLMVRKTEAHQRGVPLEQVPDFMTNPDTGFPPRQ